MLFLISEAKKFDKDFIKLYFVDIGSVFEKLR